MNFHSYKFIPDRPKLIDQEYLPLVIHLSSAIPLGGTSGKGGDFVQDPVEALDFPLLEGDTEQSKLRNSPSQMGITLKSIKPQ